MGKEYVAEGLLAAFAPYDLAGQRVLLPRAAVARDLVPAELARRGAAGRRGGGLPDGGAGIRARPRRRDLRRGAQAGLDHVHQFLDGARTSWTPPARTRWRA